MWEEQPEFQKAQARLMGMLVLALIGLYVGAAIYNRDWDLLKTTLLFMGAFVIAMGILIGAAWLVVKIFRLDRESDGLEATPKS